jgi:hypothetical protein
MLRAVGVEARLAIKAEVEIVTTATAQAAVADRVIIIPQHGVRLLLAVSA